MGHFALRQIGILENVKSLTSLIVFKLVIKVH